jgi:hypothetical protein
MCLTGRLAKEASCNEAPAILCRSHPLLKVPLMARLATLPSQLLFGRDLLPI